MYIHVHDVSGNFFFPETSWTFTWPFHKIILPIYVNTCRKRAAHGGKYGETCGGRNVAISCNTGKIHGDGLSQKGTEKARYKRGKRRMDKAGIRVSNSGRITMRQWCVGNWKMPYAG